MKFTIERDELADRLAVAGRAVKARGGLFVLSGLHLQASQETLTVTGTDLDMTVRAEAPARVETAGQAVLPARLLTDLVRSLPIGDVAVEALEEEVEISAGRTRLSMRMLSTDEFPALPEPSENAVTVPSGELAVAFRQVVPAASSDESRPILTGVLLVAHEGGLRLVATDSYRLALRDLPSAAVLGDADRVLIPSRALEELSRMLDRTDEVTVRLGDRDVTFEITAGGRHTSVTSRLIMGEFPSYAPLIPTSYDNLLRVDRSMLLESVRRLRLLARDTNSPVRLELGAEVTRISASSQDVGSGSEEISVQFEGEEVTVAFNPEYLIEGLEAAQTDDVELARLDALKPAVLRVPGDDSFLYLLMPVRVS